jgi:pimeloyl-ACP methyl ester carboxylesterase
MTPEQNETNLVKITMGNIELEGNLIVPDGARGIVLFAHGSGSSRHSPRNRAVAADLRQEGNLGTLLFDLLTGEEEVIDRQTRHLRFDIPMLADRLSGATDWLLDRPEAEGKSLGYFGSSTGSAAALIASVEQGDTVEAVVSRGGRVDLASDVLPEVEAPTLMIVGGRDQTVLKLNRQAAERLDCEHEISVVEGATHLFEEPGALDEVARLAREWFEQHLAG